MLRDHGPWLVLWVASLAAPGVIASGCYYYSNVDDPDDDIAFSTPTMIHIEDERAYDSGGALHSWVSPGGTARVTFIVDDYHYGDVAVFIYDSLGDLIYLNVVDTYSGYWYAGDDWESFEVGFTADGVPGLWTILLDYHDFTGDVTLEIEAL